MAESLVDYSGPCRTCFWRKNLTLDDFAPYIGNQDLRAIASRRLTGCHERRAVELGSQILCTASVVRLDLANTIGFDRLLPRIDGRLAASSLAGHDLWATAGEYRSHLLSMRPDDA